MVLGGRPPGRVGRRQEGFSFPPLAHISTVDKPQPRGIMWALACGPLAQLEEQGTLNPLVAGSSPAWVTSPSANRRGFFLYKLIEVNFKPYLKLIGVWCSPLPSG